MCQRRGLVEELRLFADDPVEQRLGAEPAGQRAADDLVGLAGDIVADRDGLAGRLGQQLAWQVRSMVTNQNTRLVDATGRR